MRIGIGSAAVSGDPKKIVNALDIMSEVSLTHRRVLNTKGCAAYSLRCEGMAWWQVAKNLDQKTDTAQKCAKGFAKNTGMPWPVPVDRMNLVENVK